MTAAQFLESMLYNCFKAQGVDDRRSCREAAQTLVEAFPSLADAASQAERDTKIYELRASMPEAAIAARFGITVRRVQQIVKEQMEHRRKAA